MGIWTVMAFIYWLLHSTIIVCPMSIWCLMSVNPTFARKHCPISMKLGVFIMTMSSCGSLPRWRSGVSHSLQCSWPVWPPGSGGLGSTPGSSGLSVHAGQLSAYSEINISDRHKGSACVLLNMLQATRTGFKGARTSSASQRWDNRWGTISSAQSQRNPTYRPSS